MPPGAETDFVGPELMEFGVALEKKVLNYKYKIIFRALQGAHAREGACSECSLSLRGNLPHFLPGALRL